MKSPQFIWVTFIVALTGCAASPARTSTSRIHDSGQVLSPTASGASGSGGATSSPESTTSERSFGGIGLVLETNETGQAVVKDTLPGSPAAGKFRPGDVILSVDGTSTAHTTLSGVVQLVRGEVGTKVTITHLRYGKYKLRSVLERAQIAPSPSTGNTIPDADATKVETLLVSQESNNAMLRQRNRALISFKVLTLPQILRERKTAELTALSIQIEQVILDLNHEAELAKDRAQRSMEQAPAIASEQRELAIGYKERIEVLKPIVAAIKQEIANRSR